MKNRTIIHHGGRPMKLDFPKQELLNHWATHVSDTTVIAAMLYFIGINEKWQNILELGTGQGLTGTALHEVVEKTNGKILTVDILPDNDRRSLPKSQRIHELIESTHNVSAVKKVLHELEMDELDCIWIDADHRKEAVKQDFEDYNHLIRPEGMILFHDVCVLDPECEVPEWWMDTEFPGFEKFTLSFNNGLGMLRKIS